MKLTAKIVLMVVVPVTLLAALAGAIHRHAQRSAQSDGAQHRLESAAKASARMLQDELQRIESIALALASLESATDHLGWRRAGLGALAEDPRLDTENTLARFAASHPDFASLELHDRSGDRFAAVLHGRKTVAPQDAAGEEWFAHARDEGSSVVWDGDQIRIARSVETQPEGQDPLWICASIVVPVDTVAERALAFVNHALPGTEFQIEIRGQRVSGLPAPEHTSVLRASASLPFVGGQLLLEQDRSAAIADTEGIRRTLAALVLGLLIIIPFITLSSLRGLVLRPATDLSALVSAFERQVELPPPGPGERGRADELGTLARSFRRSIEQSRSSERRLRELMQDLEQRVSERTHELAATNVRLAAASEAAKSATLAKSAFLANMSHEIRTPMTSILGFTDLLQDPGSSESDRMEAFQVIHRNGQHLLALINDILDLSKIEAGKLRVERTEVDVPALLDDLRTSFADRASERGNELQFTIEGEIPEIILSDPVRLKQSLVNLVGNALKFTENGRVEVRAHCDRDLESLVFEVADTGLGMTEEQRLCLFRPFTQAEASTTRRFGGTGLGLSITAQLAALLDGRVDCESEPGRGSTFRLTIGTGDLESATWTSELRASPPRVAAPEPGGASVEARILLVEDGRDNQRLIGLLLRRMGAEVEFAENGQLGMEAVLAAEESGAAFDLVLMDMQMPVLDGYTATRRLREEGYTGRIVALTAHSMEGELERCLEAGCDAYLSKPVDRTLLQETVAEAASVTEPALSS